MWWIAGLVALGGLLGVVEWRSWKKPSRPDFNDDAYNGAALNHDRPLIGGTDI